MTSDYTPDLLLEETLVREFGEMLSINRTPSEYNFTLSDNRDVEEFPMTDEGYSQALSWRAIREARKISRLDIEDINMEQLYSFFVSSPHLPGEIVYMNIGHGRSIRLVVPHINGPFVVLSRRQKETIKQALTDKPINYQRT